MKLSRLSGLLQFILGFFLGMALLAGGAATAAYFLLSSMTSPPPKPLFAEEKKELAAQNSKVPSQKASPPQELPSGSYKAKIIWNEGLSLRAEASTQSARLGTLAYKTEVVVLGTNEDKTWQKIRVLSDGQIGWIKGGNIEKVD